MTDTVCYFNSLKNRHHPKAIAEGWGARLVSSESGLADKRAKLHLCSGLQHGGLEIMQRVMETKASYVFFDRAYFGGGPGTDRLRATFGAYQKNWIDQRPPDRFEKTGLKLQPWRKDGEHVLFIPPSEAIVRLFGLGRTISQLYSKVKSFGRPVMHSVKGDERPLAQRLEGCWCVVTWTSNVAVEAICAGIPAFVSIHSAAAPVAGFLNRLDDLFEFPPMPEREYWAWSLAYGEFSLQEIESGFAREIISEDKSYKGR